ncbi:MAG: hypothetical protein ACYTG0_34850 [Planctomycetota bacterium]
MQGEFSSQVAVWKGGCRWVENPSDAPKSGLYLEPKMIDPERTYDPLRDEVDLFHILAYTDPTPKGVLGFANRYGLLWRGSYTSVR